MTGTQLKTWRTNAGLTQAEAAERLGVAANTVARWERGELSVPSFVDGLVDRKKRETPASYLQRAMEEQGLTMRDIVRRSGGRVHLATLSSIRRGAASNPSLDFMLALAKGIGRSPTEVFQAFCGEPPRVTRDVMLENIQRNYAMVPEKKRGELRFLIEILNREVNARLRED